MLCVGWFLELATLNLRYKRKKREVFFLETASSSIFEEKHAMVGTKDHWYFSSSSEAKATPKAKSSVMNHQTIFNLRRESTQVKVVARVVVAVVVNAVTAGFTVAGAGFTGAGAVVAASAVVVVAVIVGGGGVAVVAAALAVAAVLLMMELLLLLLLQLLFLLLLLLQLLLRCCLKYCQGTKVPNRTFVSVSCSNGRLPFLQQPLPPPPISWEPPPPSPLPMTVLAQPQCTYFGFSGRAKERSMLLLPSLPTQEIAGEKKLGFFVARFEGERPMLVLIDAIES